MYYSNDPRTKHLRRSTRKNATYSEKLLWEKLRKKQLRGYKFRRNHQIGRYYLDFYCVSLKLCIEIDGKVHDTQQEYDEIRDVYLENLGITVLRFSNNQVNFELDLVLKEITKKLPFSS